MAKVRSRSGGKHTIPGGNQKHTTPEPKGSPKSQLPAKLRKVNDELQVANQSVRLSNRSVRSRTRFSIN